MINGKELVDILSLHGHGQLIGQLKVLSLLWSLDEHLLLHESVLDVLLHVDLYPLTDLIHLDSQLFPQLKW